MAYVIFGSAMSRHNARDIDIVPCAPTAWDEAMFRDLFPRLPVGDASLPIDWHPELYSGGAVWLPCVSEADPYAVVGDGAAEIVVHRMVRNDLSTIIRRFSGLYGSVPRLADVVLAARQARVCLSTGRLFSYGGDGPQALSSAWAQLRSGPELALRYELGRMGAWGALILALARGEEFSVGNDPAKGDPCQSGPDGEILPDWSDLRFDSLAALRGFVLRFS